MARDTVLIDDDDDVDLEEEEANRNPSRRHARVNGGEDSDDDDDDDYEEQNEYEADEFIVADVDEEDEERQTKKKKRPTQKNYVLDEDDYELLADNNITGFHRLNQESKTFKRLKKARKDTDEGHSGTFNERVFAGTGNSGRTAQEQLKYNLFGDDEELLFEDIAEEEKTMEVEEDDGIEEEDEMADFIVDEEETDEHSASMRQRKSNKNSWQGTGVSSSATQEAYEIFGGNGDVLRCSREGFEKMNSYNESGVTKLEDEFEPIVLSEKYMTGKDEQIWEKDLPERLQMSEEITGPPPTDNASIEEESNWIYNQFVNGRVPFYNLSRTTQCENEKLINKEDIKRFLELLHIQKYDVPFIAMYRKDACLSLFSDPVLQEVDIDNQNKTDDNYTAQWHKVLWAIEGLDRKWLLLQKRKSALQSYYNKRFKEEIGRIYDEARMTLNQQLFESVMKSLKASESEREVDDVDLKFNLHFPPGEVGGGEGTYKRPKRKSQYSICSNAGLWEFAGKFGYNSEQFGLQISLEKTRMDELEDALETPEDLASLFTCAMFETSEAVLRGTRHMAAVEISCEPSVRRHIRSVFMENAVVCTTPTSEGNTAIDTLHLYAGVKWLKDKPLARFDDAQWLLIEKAQEEKFLQVAVKLPESGQNKLISDWNDYYLSDGVSKYTQLWNEQRKMILKDALFDFLLPSMEKEARSWLTSRAKNWLLMHYGKLLWDKVSMAPFKPKEKDDRLDDEAGPKVMACCWGPGRPSTIFVMLDPYGEVVDTLEAGFLSARSQNVNDQQRKNNDKTRLTKFLIDHQPHLVVLGASNLYCTRLKEDIYEIICKIVEDNPQDVGQTLDSLKIVFGNDCLPQLYENSRISSDQLSSHSGIVKRAVALGRYMQNPIAMVATLCGAGREILSWKLSPLEKFLSPDEKYGVVEQIMVDITNQVGLDVNLAIAHEWLFSPLQFISGFGPRKAAFFMRSLSKAGAVYTRKDFITAHHVGKRVFINAVGFLRVRRSGLAASGSQYIDFLDDTRIHPESYSLAQDLAKDIYKGDGHGDVNDDYDLVLEHVREKPELRHFDIDSYATSKSLESKKQILENIKLELLHGFHDWRRQYEEPSQDEEFNMISGETDDTLAEGRIVQVTVRRVTEQKAICVLESGLTGMLLSEDYTVGGETDPDLTEKLHEGDTLSCRIKSIQKNRYLVYLSCKENEMRAIQVQNNQERDPFYHEDRNRNSSQSEHEKGHKEKELSKKHFKPRMIVHPRFQNITADEAIELLSMKGPGESVFRPSSRGPSYLTLTLKVGDGVYAHKDIAEGGKEHKDITSLLRLGKTLKIGEEMFENLDEVMDRYIDPLVTNLKKMLSYRKFQKGTKTEVDELLRIEKTEYPMRIVFCIGISYEHPGSFILTFIRSTNPHHEYIGLYPKGFKFRKKMFEDVDRLVAYFQSHIDDVMPSNRSVSAMAATSGWDGSRSERNYQDGGNGDGRGRGRGHGRGRGRGRGRGWGSYGGDGYDSFANDEKDADYGSQKWGAKESGDAWGSSSGAKSENSPGKEAFPGGWGSNASGSAGGWSGGVSGGGDSGSGWGNGGGGGTGGGGSGWGTGGGWSSSGGVGSWGSGGGDENDGGGKGGGHGRGRGSHDRGNNGYENDRQDTTGGGGWSGGSSDGGKSWEDGGGWSGRGGREHGRGRGRGHGSFGRANNTDNDGQDTGYGSQKWGAKDGNDTSGGSWSSGGGGGWSGRDSGEHGGRGRGRGRGSYGGGRGNGSGNDGQEGGGGSGGWSSGDGGGWRGSQGGSGWKGGRDGGYSGGTSGWGGSGGGGSVSKDTNAEGGSSGWGGNKQTGSGWGGGGSGSEQQQSGGGGTGSVGGVANEGGWGGSQSGSGKVSGGWGCGTEGLKGVGGRNRSDDPGAGGDWGKNSDGSSSGGGGSGGGWGNIGSANADAGNSGWGTNKRASGSDGGDGGWSGSKSSGGW